MTKSSTIPEALAGLCSERRHRLLDTVDHLRQIGIDYHVSLPQIIVCGDQSSGKSSVLQAISGVPFPVKNDLCTRFPTELVLRKNDNSTISVSIVSQELRDESEQGFLTTFEEKLVDLSELPQLIINAQTKMGKSMQGAAFSRDLLRIEITGPDRPHLTVVDLPGVVHSETKQHTASDVRLIRDVVMAYMKESRSIILAVVSAKNDVANQIVLDLARQADPAGARTLGVITKPDTLMPASSSESAFAALAQNDDVHLQLGWHVVKNLDSEQRVLNQQHRDLEEEQFFAGGIWTNLPRTILGIKELRKRLSSVLIAQIVAELPGLLDDIANKQSSYRSELEKLGQPRTVLDDQRLYLLRASQSFQSLVKAAVDGTYNEPFFEGSSSDGLYAKNLRAVVQNRNEKFAREMEFRGHSRTVAATDDKKVIAESVEVITRGGFITHVQKHMRRMKGRELPGTFNPMVVGDLFIEQAKPWRGIVEAHIIKLWNAAKRFVHLAIAAIVDEETSTKLLETLLDSKVQDLLKALQEKTLDLCQQHSNLHAISYNQAFVEGFRKSQAKSLEADFSDIICRQLGVSSRVPLVSVGKAVDLEKLVKELVACARPLEPASAASQALDCMFSYYEVARCRFVDDVAVEAVEARLMSGLTSVFSPEIVYKMSADLVQSIAGESAKSGERRRRLTQQIATLNEGFEVCQDFIGETLPEFTSAGCMASDSPMSRDLDHSRREGAAHRSATPSSSWSELCDPYDDLKVPVVEEPMPEEIGDPDHSKLVEPPLVDVPEDVVDSSVAKKLSKRDKKKAKATSMSFGFIDREQAEEVDPGSWPTWPKTKAKYLGFADDE